MDWFRQIALLIICAITLAGCDPLSSIFPTPPKFQGAYQVGASEIEDNAAGCGATLNDTPFEPWIEQYQNAPNQTVNIFWKAPVASSGPLNIYSGTLLNTNFHQAFNDAVTGWYDALNDTSRLPSGHYLRLYPALTDYWNTALVQTNFDDYYFDPRALATTDFGTVTGPGSVQTGATHSTENNAGQFLAGSIITFHRRNIQNAGLYGDTAALYSTSVHEIGHALGLDHNPRVGSFMHPSVENGVPGLACNYYGALPPRADTDNLIYQYDPVLNADETTPTPRPCSNCRIYYSKSGPRNSASTAADFHPRGNPAARGQRESIFSSRNRAMNAMLRGLKPNQRNVEGFMRHLAWHHGPVDGAVDYRSISVDSLALASNVIATGHVIRVVSKSAIGPMPSVAYKEFQIDQVQDSAGVSVSVGQHITIAEQYAYEDIPYVDDPELAPGQEATVFLRRVGSMDSRAVASVGSSSYEFTAPLVSKWLSTSDGRVIVGRASSRIALQLNGMAFGVTMRKLRGEAPGGVRATSRAVSARRISLLQSRGIPQSTYVSIMQNDPRQMLVNGARSDVRQGR